MIEIKEFETTTPFDVTSYPSTGLYNVAGDVFYVNKKTMFILCLEKATETIRVLSWDSKKTKAKEIKQEIKQEPEPMIELIAEKSEPTITEDFFFKTMALVHNGEKYKDIKS